MLALRDGMKVNCKLSEALSQIADLVLDQVQMIDKNDQRSVRISRKICDYTLDFLDV